MLTATPTPQLSEKEQLTPKIPPGGRGYPGHAIHSKRNQLGKESDPDFRLGSRRMKRLRMHLGRPQRLAALLLLLFLGQCLWVIGHQELTTADYRFAQCGREMWEHYEPRGPVEVQFDKNVIRVVFKKEVEVLRFLSL